MNRSETDKQRAMREAEKERYLASLKAKEEERKRTKEQSKQAEIVRSEQAASDKDVYLNKISSRTEFRSSISEKRKADAETNQEIMDKLGQEYRGKLQWFANRFDVRPEDLDKLNETE